MTTTTEPTTNTTTEAGTATTGGPAVLDLADATRLAHAFNQCFTTFEADEDAIADDVFCDLYPPFWRFQLRGRRAMIEQLRAIAKGSSSAEVLRVVPTATGFVMEHEETQRGEGTEIARRLWLCEVRDGRISEIVGYCNGGWDDETRVRHAAEAPMLLPWETDR
jgi:hypothetical protein